MKIGFVGMGKLGLPVALAIESKGHDVRGYDVDSAVYGYLEHGQIPYVEEGLEPLLQNNRISLRSTVAGVVCDSDIVFVPIQTPHQPEYEGTSRLPEKRVDFDYSHLTAGLVEIAQAADDLGKKVTVAVISTCLPGTFEYEIQPLLSDNIDYVYTPQFIAMGTVLQDYLHPEFNLIGVQSTAAARLLEKFYGTINDAPCLSTDITTAEGIKLSYNSWITAKTVLANAWGELSELMGMKFDDIRRAWELSDRRLISKRYMDAGMSDGGGCHPRDNIAMSHLAKSVGMSHDIWEDLMLAREGYERWHAQLLWTWAVRLNLPMVILGRSFKPETNIETGSPALLMASLLGDFHFEGGPELLAHVEHWVVAEQNGQELPVAVYFIATKHARYAKYPFPAGSAVLDPFGYIPDQPGVTVKWLGRR